MATKEKKVTATIMVCDFCGSDIKDTGTQIKGAADGYMKRDHLQLDLCEKCASQAGLKRRGRRPADQSIKPAATEDAGRRPRGRPRKSAPVQEDDWETPARVAES